MEGAPDPSHWTSITVTTTAPITAQHAFTRLTTPRRAAGYVTAVLPVVYAHLDEPPTDVVAATAGGRWLFFAEPRARRLHWELTAPVHLAGVLRIQRRDGHARLLLTVQDYPESWARQRVRALAREALARLRDRLADDAAQPVPTARQPAAPVTLADATERLFAEFGDRVPLPSIWAIVGEARHDLAHVPDAQRAALIERLAWHRLTAYRSTDQ